MNFSFSKRLAVLNKTNGKCWYCGIELVIQTESYAAGKSIYTIDHIQVFEDYINDDISNLVPACRTCNSGKCHKDLEDFRVFESMKRGLRFTENQRKYWLSQRITLPEDRLLVFYFEEQGLQS